MRKLLTEFRRDENGAAAIEYALIVALIGAGLVIGLQDLGRSVAGLYADIGRALDGVLSRMN